ncbi:hypothetical protein P5V15_007723 [Pogonomyrmex californicus]
MFAEGKDAEEGKEDRGEVRRVILIGGVSGDVLLKRSQVVSVLVLKSEKKHPDHETIICISELVFFYTRGIRFLILWRKEALGILINTLLKIRDAIYHQPTITSILS